MSGSIGEHVMREGNTKDGLFAIACWTHTSFEEGRLIRGLTHLQAMHEWVSSPSMATGTEPQCNSSTPAAPSSAIPHALPNNRITQTATLPLTMESQQNCKRLKDI